MQLLAAVAGRLVVDASRAALPGFAGAAAAALRSFSACSRACTSAWRRASSSAVRLRFSSSLLRRFSSSRRSRSSRSFSSALAFGALERGLRLLLGLALAVDLFLLVPRLILEHLALDVGALAAHLDVDRAGAALRARELQLRLRLAPQGDLAGRGIGLRVVAAVAAAQMREQLVLRILADHVLGAVDLDPGLIELLQQPVDRHLQNLGELRDRYICHARLLGLLGLLRFVSLPRTSACAHP